MKFFTAIIFTATVISLHALMAQDANVVPLPDTTPSPLSPQTGSQPSPTPLSLIPDMPAPVEKPSRRSSGGTSGGSRPGAVNPVKKNTTETNTNDIADRIKFREAKTKALRDEKVQEQLALAESAKNDREKRIYLKKYYTLLYAKILKIDGSIKKLVSQRQAQSLKQLDQSKVRPEEYEDSSAAN